MYYSYVEIEHVAMSFSPTRTDLAVKLLNDAHTGIGIFCTFVQNQYGYDTLPELALKGASTGNKKEHYAK
jgi:hypothetical protein